MYVSAQHLPAHPPPATHDNAESMLLSPAEEEAEQLMRQAAVAWNVHRNREAAEKLQRKALEAVTKEVCVWAAWLLSLALVQEEDESPAPIEPGCAPPLLLHAHPQIYALLPSTHTPPPLKTTQAGAARPEIVAEVASSLADMMYATQKLTEAKDALQVRPLLFVLLLLPFALCAPAGVWGFRLQTPHTAACHAPLTTTHAPKHKPRLRSTPRRLVDSTRSSSS